MNEDSSIDDFASAFNEGDTADTATAQANEGQDERADEHQDEPTADNGDTGAAGDEGADESNEGADQGEPTADQSTAAAQPEAQPQVDWEVEAKRWKDRYSTLQGKYNAEVARGNRGNDGPRAGDPKPAAAQPAAPAAAASNEEDEQLLAELDEQLPTVAKAVRRLVAREREAIEQSIYGRLAPIENDVVASARDRHFAAIRSAHQDFDAIAASPDLNAWVDEQPAYLAASYRNVMEQGSAEDVIDLIARFKKETAPAAPAPAPKPTQQPNRTGALRAAAAPRLRSTAAIPHSVDPSDFGAAWAD